jgi:hypothetical protein
MQQQKPLQQPLAKKPRSQTQTSRRRKGGIVATLFSILLIGASFAVFYNRQAILDQITVWRFTPSAPIVAMAGRAGLSDTGKFYLYASQAQLSNRDAFNAACGKLQSERTVVLGCYTGADRRIYIYDVTDTRLDGVKETTAAHEMLHAAYDRLCAKDKDYVDGLLKAEETKITDERILNLIKEYQKTEPNEVVNELHSIIGTEIRTLSPELEAYYKRYFANRSEVVALKEKYEKVFTDIASQQTALVNELNTLASDINTRQKSYQASLGTLNSDIETFNSWAQSGTATKNEYAAGRASLQSRITALDTERNAINSEIDTYNTKKAVLDKLNLQATTLNQSIDSKVTETPSL